MGATKSSQYSITVSPQQSQISVDMVAVVVVDIIIHPSFRRAEAALYITYAVSKPKQPECIHLCVGSRCMRYDALLPHASHACLEAVDSELTVCSGYLVAACVGEKGEGGPIKS